LRNEKLKKVVENQKGSLYVVATPIGNLQDFSQRAQSTLQNVDYIAAEDTRHSYLLLKHFSIKTPLFALHEHNEKQACQVLIEYLHSGKNIALISDAGTPSISDPGTYLIQSAHAAHIPVLAIPGPSAVTSALSVSGLPADRFVFEGFLPSKPQARQQCLEKLQYETRTLVFYEAPHRILDSLTTMISVFGKNRTAVLAKEISKLHETVYSDTLHNILNWLTFDSIHQKGEFVIIVQGAPHIDRQLIDNETKRIFTLLRQDLSLKQTAKLCSQITGINKNALYALGLEEQKSKDSKD